MQDDGDRSLDYEHMSRGTAALTCFSCENVDRPVVESKQDFVHVPN